VSAQIFGVGELIRQVNAALAGAFSGVWVRGELSGVKIAGSGHRYFQIKDAEGTLSCAMWAARADRLRFKLTDGLAVLLYGSLEVYPQRGSLQLIVAEVRPEGIGELQLAFEQLKAKLEGEGLFARERKRPMPALPLRVGVVTSPSGAAIRDVLKVLSRWERLAVLLAPVRVQGRGAEGEIAQALGRLGRSGLVDVILLVRGGGSLEDLWAFNEEMVARAIAASPVPVISGVGHEVDVSIADFVADIRAATPTQAAELVVAQLERQERHVAEQFLHLTTALQRRLEHLRLRLEVLAGARGLSRVPARLRALDERLTRLAALAPLLRRVVSVRHRRLDGLVSRLYRWPVRFGAPRRRELVTARLSVAAERLRSLVQRRALLLAGAERTLAALSPVAVLQRGYSITWNEGCETPLRSPSETSAGSRLRTRLAGGEIRSLVLGGGGVQGSLFDAPDDRRGEEEAQG
jgi:exodeoxyribonuclease VII large subunit